MVGSCCSPNTCQREPPSDTAVHEPAGAATVAVAAATWLPKASRAHTRGHIPSRSADRSEFKESRLSTSAAVSYGAMVWNGRLVDGFLVEFAEDPTYPAAGQAEHHCRFRDGLPTVESRNGQKFDEEVVQGAHLQEALRDGVHERASQNELVPLRDVVQVHFFENTRAAALSGPRVNRVTGVAGGVKALLAKAMRERRARSATRPPRTLRSRGIGRPVQDQRGVPIFGHLPRDAKLRKLLPLASTRKGNKALQQLDHKHCWRNQRTATGKKKENSLIRRRIRGLCEWPGRMLS
ncbi:hypothetical protein C2845_PM09G18620 [Panicum miliaceum]|uniref:Uncharacterized protein n=1 Tax=Panicum miliaceum TaxID=4540 RepID=A0A3L6S0A2_PANMI|nr:hypothetical protein C2845_PM09G18620 [Panicum miliaceum]